MSINKTCSDTKEKLNSVGCGFCLAKWTQVTIHLQMGRTHSCHHPDTHIIPLEELENNPSALHNTKFKKSKRKEMLDGKRPEECGYCWNVEDNSKQFSDRIFKSSESWSLPLLEEIKTNKWDDDFNPRYVEVAFSNTCNFKCSYCGPSFSSQWVQESEKYGGYPTFTNFNSLDYLKRENRMPFKSSEHNPYVDAFWKWWPDLYRDLHTFRITGGEPLLHKDTWDVLDYIIENPNPNKELHLAINSNLGVPDELINKFIEKINRMEDGQKVKDFVIFTSVDGWGEQAEYGRHGMIFNKFWDNINKILSKCPTVTIGIMSTYNTLSVPSYHKLIDSVNCLKMEYASIDRAWSTPITLDASFLRHPLHQTVQILPYDFSKIIKSHSERAQILKDDFHKKMDSTGCYGYTDVEVSKMERIYDWMISPQDTKQQMINRRDFYRFFNEHDNRRGTNFIKTFPEYEEFYYFCKDIIV
jgi:hypothetical protein